jgi:basic amino acid/polyamine antiporter, APA family
MSLKRELTLFDAVLLIMGNMIGAGIFTTSGFLAGELPHPLYFIGIWVVGGVLTICGALTYAELAGMYPLAGGDYHFLKAAYGKWAGFFLGWVSFWIIGPGSIAAMAIALASYLKSFMAIGYGNEVLTAIAIIILFSLVNYRGLRLGGTTQDIFTIGTLCILAAFIVCGLLFGSGDWTHFKAVPVAPVPFTRLFSAPMIAVIFTFSGWFASAYIGSEIRNPERNLPLSLFIGTLLVALIYTLINFIYLYSTPLNAMKNVVDVARLSTANLFNPSVAGLISLPIILAIASTINATILTGARIYYAMAEDGIIWNRLRELHPTYNTPYISIAIQAVISCMMALLGTFNELLSCVVFVMLLSSIAGGTALFVLRRRTPEARRPYRTWGYPIVPLLFVVSYIWIAVQICAAKPATSLLGVIITLSGLPFYIRWEARHRNQPTFQGSEASP